MMIWTWQTRVEADSLLMLSGAFYANDHHDHHSHATTLPYLPLLAQKILKARLTSSRRDERPEPHPNRLMTLTDALLRPASICEMYVLSTPTRSASAACVKPRCSRQTRKVDSRSASRCITS
jgi:hypothetical protein